MYGTYNVKKTNNLAFYKPLFTFFTLLPPILTIFFTDPLVTELKPYSRVLHKLYCRQLLKNFLTLTVTIFY